MNVLIGDGEVAKEHDIPLYENKPLARVLYDTVEIDQYSAPLLFCRSF